MSMGGVSVDHKGVLVEKLGEDSERFDLSNTNLKNGKGLHAIFDIETLEDELYDIAKDPSLGADQLGPLRPKEPKLSDEMSDEEQKQALKEWRELMVQWETAQSALKMQVPISDMFAIKRYMNRYWKTVHATPAVKAMRFKALTKNPESEQQGGFFGFGKKNPGG